jgi:phosphoribosylaminoimidazole-succinocarboxamide synthase
MYQSIIKSNLHNCLTETNLNIGNPAGLNGGARKKVGKVRDTYELPEKMILITTDRQSAFDRILASVPFKGQVLNQISAWWFDKTKHIVPNHVLSIPDPNVTVGKKCTVFPVEFVVRGYITGTTDTSAWMNYQNGVRNFCGNDLPEGLKKNQKFDRPIITPTTKSDEHDRSISPTEIVAERLMTQADWDYVSGKALEIFEFGQTIAASHGLILVDTKYEFGKDADGNILLIDEIHTPDSSRYWIAKSYDERLAKGEEPENIDKEFLRLWFKDHCDPYNDKVLPPAPDDLVIELSRRYIMLYEMITGEKFVFPEGNIQKRLNNNINKIVP